MRKPGEVVPVKVWGVLVAMCKVGRFRPSEYAEFGRPYAAKKAIGTLRALLKAAFGLEAEPLRTYTKYGGWEPVFRVGPKRRD